MSGPLTQPERVRALLDSLDAEELDGLRAGARRVASIPRRVTLVVEGDPVPKGRARTVVTPSGKRRTFTPTRTAQYEEQIGYVWVADLGRPEPFTGTVAVTIQVRERVHPSDLDNYVKVVLDALNELAWDDDRQVEALHATIERHSQNPGITIEITAQ